MKRPFIAPLLLSALLSTAAACSGPADNPADTAAVEAPAEATIIDDLGGDPAGPTFTKAKADTLAVSGFDVVSYFSEDGVPVEGSQDFTVRYQGYDYRFASDKNAQTFIADPARYAPAYGGYCAWAIGANDALAPGDPQVYEIVDGTLYLNYSADVQAKWEKDIPGFIAKADTNYPTHRADEHYQD